MHWYTYLCSSQDTFLTTFIMFMVKQFFLFFFVSLRFFRYIVLVSRSFSLQIFSWLSNFFGSFSFRFDFFASFCFISRSFSLQFFAVSLRCETSEIMPFFASKRNENFASVSIFASEAKRKGGRTLVETIFYIWPDSDHTKLLDHPKQKPRRGGGVSDR